MTPLEIFNTKSNFLDARELILKRKVSTAEMKLLSIIIDRFIDQLEKSGGIIINNGRNITLTQALELIFKEFEKNINSTIIKGYIDDIVKGQALNSRYFGTFVDDSKRFDIIRKIVQTTIGRRLGIAKNGTLKVGGYLYNFLKDNRIKNEVLELVTRAITSESSVSTVKSELKVLIAGDDKIDGQLSNQYRTFINDTYQQVDNLESNLYAEELGLQAAFYSGGKIKTTRNFCCQRNGLVFTIDEIKSWKNLTFQGKNKDYNPITDQGGYNCRHRYRYIINAIALKKRPDLKESKSGRLIPIKGKSNQKLNKCA